MIRPPHDGWVDTHAARQARKGENVLYVSADDARRMVASFRGEVLAAAYSLESSLETLILWHLFRDRQDGMAAFFEDMVLREPGFGLERKVRLACAIIDHWVDEDACEGDKALLGRARRMRNQVAHWPARLIPIEHEGDTVGYDIELVRDNRTVTLDEAGRSRTINDFAVAKRRLNELANQIAEFARFGEN